MADMVLGKKVAILIWNGAKIRPLEVGRKAPVYICHLALLFDFTLNKLSYNFQIVHFCLI